MHTTTILAATNKQIDNWNTIIQQMNPNYSEEETQACKICFSSDVLNAVDDPRDVISSMLTTEILNRFNSDKAPPHVLKLCVGDICYLMRTLGRRTKLATNQRVRILELRKFSVFRLLKTIVLPEKFTSYLEFAFDLLCHMVNHTK